MVTIFLLQHEIIPRTTRDADFSHVVNTISMEGLVCVTALLPYQVFLSWLLSQVPINNLSFASDIW